MHVYMHAFKHARMHACKCSICMCMYVHVCVMCICAHARVCEYSCMRVRASVRECVFV